MLRRPILPVFNSYHHSESLLFQFVLHEFLRTLGEVFKIESVITDETTPEQIHGALTDYLMKLAGTEQDYLRIFTWIYDAGVLTKLKNTVDLLSQKVDFDDTEMRALHLVVHKAWLECLHCIDLYRNQELKALKPQIFKTIKLIRKIPLAIKKVLHRFEEDENIILFLVKNKKEFDRIVGEAFLEGLVNSDSVEFLKERYQKRGFNHLIPEIEAYAHAFS
jgi:hypothetical protein